MVYQVVINAIHNDEDKGTSKLVYAGVHEVLGDDMNDVSEKAKAKARQHPLYAEVTAGDTELVVKSMRLLTKAKDL